ncbi:MAG: hypothetical protein NT069_27180, partial [Planctomycetota bacterium]|nr:hypothetical protein [Planctomycetota bacterium]
PTSMTYPNGRVLASSYGTAGGANDVLSRISALVDNDGTTQLAAYQYLGLGAFVEVDYTEPDIKYTLIDLSSTNDPDTGDIYSGMDRFSRVKDCRWYNYASSTDVDRFKYGYDRTGSREYREDTVATALAKSFDELYGNDLMERLKSMERGTLNAQKTAVTNKQFGQCWTLDETGNWKWFREDADGNGTWDLIQSRTDNKVNEITALSNSFGPTWVTPSYNRAGNMTTVPQPADPTKGYTATYDAWNRLVKTVDEQSSQIVQEYAYDGRTFRSVRNTYTAGVLSESRQLFYSTIWQVVEERLGTATSAERQLIWGLRYIDDLVVRDRDTSGSGTLNERLYVSQDANWSVSAIARSDGTIVERFAFQSYGAPTFLSPEFTSRSTSNFDWDRLYTGHSIDIATGLICARHRFLDSATGTLLGRDPLGPISGVDLYEYVNSSPHNKSDPFGLLPYDCIACVAWVAASYGPGAAVCISTFYPDTDSVQDCLSNYTGSMHWLQHAVPGAACAVCLGRHAGPYVIPFLGRCGSAARVGWRGAWGLAKATWRWIASTGRTIWTWGEDILLRASIRLSWMIQQAMAALYRSSVWLELQFFRLWYSVSQALVTMDRKQACIIMSLCYYAIRPALPSFGYDHYWWLIREPCRIASAICRSAIDPGMFG